MSRALIPWKVVPFTDEELPEQIEVAKRMMETARVRRGGSSNPHATLNRTLLKMQRNIANRKYIYDNFAVGSVFSLLGQPATVLRHLDEEYRSPNCGLLWAKSIEVCIVTTSGAFPKFGTQVLPFEFLMNFPGELQ